MEFDRFKVGSLYHSMLNKTQGQLKELQLEAQHTLQEYQMLVNTIPGAIVVYEVVDKRIETQYYSDGLCKLTGYTREERDAFNKENALNLIDDRDISYVSKAMEEAIRTQSDLTLTYRIKCKNAPSRYIRLNAAYLLNEQGRPEFHAVFSDIDEVKRLEQEREEQQIRYAVAIKSAGINVWEYDIQKDLLTVVSNSSRVKQNCYSIANYVESTVKQGYVREDSLSTFYSIFKRLKEGEKEITEDIWYKTTDEAGWWCERVIYTTVFDEHGVPIKAFGAGRDVTREKEAVRKFQEEINYRAAIQESSIGSMKINLTKNAIIEGKSALPIVMEWIEKGNADSYFSENASYITEGRTRKKYQKAFNCFALLELFNSGEYTLSEKITRKLPGDNIHWLQYNVHLMKNPENNDVVAFVAAHDITDEQVMKMIMDTVAKADFERVVVVDGINNCAMDYSYEKEKRYFHSNQEFEERMEEVIREHVVEEDRERILKNCKIDNILEKIQNEKDYKINYSIRESNGELRRKQLQFTSMHREQKTFLMTRIDVNEVFIEQEHAKEKSLNAARNAVNAKTEFLARMSHDMRTPMNGIIGVTQLSKDIPDLPKEMQDNLAAIEDSSQYLLSLINDTLDMSKIESKKMVLNYEVVLAKELIKNVLGFVAPMADSKHITIECIPIHAELEYINIDRMRMEQIFVNLLSNAIKFTSPSGKIRMEIECLKRVDGIAYDRISIEDNGIGMSKEFLPKAFEPFAQESTAITSNYAGTGLGLSIVKNIVELMGGQIQLESELGKGTKVTVYLNFERVYDYQDSDFMQKNKTVDLLKGRHVLLCEDHPLNTEIATKLLEARGMVVTCAENGAIGVKLIAESEEKHFDAILMDIRMPVMDGLEATRQIRRLNRGDTKSIPIIAMTANAFDTDRENSKNAGMTEHLAKPIEPSLLYDTLAKYIAQT